MISVKPNCITGFLFNDYYRIVYEYNLIKHTVFKDSNLGKIDKPKLSLINII